MPPGLTVAPRKEVCAVNAPSIALAVCLIGASAFAQDAPKNRVPEVLLSSQHEQMVNVGVGAEFPELELPTAAQPTDGPQSLAEQLGADATVVAVVDGPSPMAKALLRDLEFDIAKKHPVAAGETPAVATVAITTGTPAGEALNQAAIAKYTGPMLLDEQGEAFAQLGTDRLPRVYVLNGDGEVEWLDIEYSLSSRREMKQAVRALAGKATAQ